MERRLFLHGGDDTAGEPPRKGARIMAATSGEGLENPVHINIVPMVDVIFCLCVFFFCSFQFRQLEGKMESWLPRGGPIVCPPIRIVEEIRVFLRLNEEASGASSAVLRSVGPRQIRDDAHLRGELLSLRAVFTRAGMNDVPVIIEAERKVPWKEVVNVMSIARRAGWEKLEFAGSRN